MSNKKATIYTGKGDDGTTSLACGTRVRKNHPRVEAYGVLDELNAHLGMLASAIDSKEKRSFIEKIENDVFTIGSCIANENCADCMLSEEDIALLENAIDTLETSLPPMHSFILPSSNEAAARANLCRTVCRRAERTMTTFNEEHELAHKAMIYINRLSDYLFMLQRELCCGEEKKWEKPCR